MLHALAFLLSLAPFYLIGALPAGYIVARAKGVDITTVGSGNVGATNVARVLGIKSGIMILCIDIMKGITATLLAMALNSSSLFYSCASAVAVCGHCFSFPGKLRGGKGVATSLGVIAILNFWTALWGIFVFAAVFWLWRIVSLSSITAALLVPPFALLLGADDSIFYALTFIALLVVYRHKENLMRLVLGTEEKFSFAKQNEI